MTRPLLGFAVLTIRCGLWSGPTLGAEAPTLTEGFAALLRRGSLPDDPHIVQATGLQRIAGN